MVDKRMYKWNELMHLFVGYKARCLRIAFENFPWLLQYTTFGSKEMIMTIITKLVTNLCDARDSLTKLNCCASIEQNGRRIKNIC